MQTSDRGYLLFKSDTFTKLVFNINIFGDILFSLKEKVTSVSSTLGPKIVKKNTTLCLRSKLQGLATRQQPLLLSGGNQSTSGTSAYVSSHIQVFIKSVQSMHAIIVM